MITGKETQRQKRKGAASDCTIGGSHFSSGGRDIAELIFSFNYLCYIFTDQLLLLLTGLGVFAAC